MNTYKNIEIAQEYNVSSTAVLRWIEGAIKGKNNLQLYQVKNKLKIIKNEHNKAELTRLSKQSVIYKNKILYAEVSPRPEFYNIFNTDKVIEIINFLETKRVIPTKYIYMGDGATIWDNYISEGIEFGTYPTVSNDMILMNELHSYLEFETRKYNKINIIDIGPGNSISMIPTLRKFIELDRLNKYVTVDISKKMLEISKQNVLKEFPNINIEMFEGDIENDNISKVLFKDKTNNNGNMVGNLIFFIGGTIGNLNNMNKALMNFRSSMGADDYLLFSNKIDTNKTRSELGHFPSELFGWLPKLLNINVENCEITREYNDLKMQRQMAIKLDKDYSIEFNLLGTKRTINMYKGEDLILLTHHTSTVSEIFKQANEIGFKIQSMNIHEDISRMLAVFKAQLSSN